MWCFINEYGYKCMYPNRLPKLLGFSFCQWAYPGPWRCQRLAQSNVFVCLCKHSLVEKRKQVSHDHQRWPRRHRQDLSDGEGSLIQILGSCWRFVNKEKRPMCSNALRHFHRHMKRHQLSKFPGKPEYLTLCHFPNTISLARFLSYTFPSSLRLTHARTPTQQNMNSRTQAMRSLNFSLGKSGLSRLRKYIFSTPATELMSWLFSSSVKGSLPGKQSLWWERIHGDRSFEIKMCDLHRNPVVLLINDCAFNERRLLICNESIFFIQILFTETTAENI